MFAEIWLQWNINSTKLKYVQNVRKTFLAQCPSFVSVNTQLFLDLTGRQRLYVRWVDRFNTLVISMSPHYRISRVDGPHNARCDHRHTSGSADSTTGSHFQCLMPYCKTIASSDGQEDRAHLSLETIVIIPLCDVVSYSLLHRL